MATAASIMRKASVLLLDEGHVRWPLSELCEWLNEGCRAIVLAKPSARSETRVLTMTAGTRQMVETAAGDPAPLALLDVVRNVSSAESDRVAGRAVKAVGSGVLDAVDPNWHDGTKTPFKTEVRQFIYDEQVPLEFYVYPGNNGTGFVEAKVAIAPELITASGDVAAIGSYGAEVDLAELYDIPLLDYVMFRAQSKDDTAANPGRAAVHYQAFAAALGIKIQVEGGSSPNARRGQ